MSALENFLYSIKLLGSYRQWPQKSVGCNHPLFKQSMATLLQNLISLSDFYRVSRSRLTSNCIMENAVNQHIMSQFLGMVTVNWGQKVGGVEYIQLMFLCNMGEWVELYYEKELGGSCRQLVLLQHGMVVTLRKLVFGPLVEAGSPKS